ncbi:MAG: lmo0937 family membrane protein [Candidatus Paceibacterota bacterium]
MIWTFIFTMLLLWILGFSFNFGGNLIHTLLVIALVALIIRLLS